jgi:UDP-3-O-[3-hydroxymyristoyl] N-acetylglucosamine deacetylase
LRFRDEFVRHKILDVVGDLALIGRPIVGHVVARNAGHALNHQLVREIVQRARRWEGAPTTRGVGSRIPALTPRSPGLAEEEARPRTRVATL